MKVVKKAEKVKKKKKKKRMWRLAGYGVLAYEIEWRTYVNKDD